MSKKTILLLIGCLGLISVQSRMPGWSLSANASGTEQRVREAEARYASEDYLKAKQLLVSLSDSFPEHGLFSYFQFMIAKCEYHLGNYSSAEAGFTDFVHRFPGSAFVGACYLMLGNIAYLQGSGFESAQSYVYSYDLAQTDNLRLLAKRSLVPLLESRLSLEELEKLGRSNKDKMLAAKVWFYLGARQYDSGDFKEAVETLHYYQRTFPDGEDMQKIDLLLKDASYSHDKTVNLGVLVPLTGDWSPYGNSLINGIKLAVSADPIREKEVRLMIKDTQGDFVTATRLCRELISEDHVVCIIGPLRSEAVAAAAAEAERSGIPLITPTASKKGLAALSDFVFQVSPTTESKGRILAQSAVRDQGLREFVMLVPEEQEPESEATSFKTGVEGLGGSIRAWEEYASDTEDFSSHLRRIKDLLLGFSSTSTGAQGASFYDEIPVWVDGIFLSADQSKMYDILSRIANLNIIGTIIGTEVCGEKQVLEFARNIDRQMLFTSREFSLEDAAGKQRFFDLYLDQYGREADPVSMLGYDCMMLLLSVFEKTTSPLGIRSTLAETNDFMGVSGGIGFDSQGENVMIPVYKLENRQVSRLR